jgi:hypothetical protein
VSRVVRRAVIAASALVGLAAVLPLVAWIWAPLWLSAYATTWRTEIAWEREREASRERPVLRGETLDDDAAPIYRDALEAIGRALRSPKRSLYTAGLGQAVTRGPKAAPPDEVARLLEAHRADLERLGQAVRCTRCDWDFDYAQGFKLVDRGLPNLLSARVLANLMVLAGRERAQAGDRQGAAERYLDLLRFAADFDSGSSIMVQFGMILSQIGLDALVSLVTSQDPGELPLSQIESELARIDDSLPSAAIAYRRERLVWGTLSSSGRSYRETLNDAVAWSAMHTSEQGSAVLLRPPDERPAGPRDGGVRAAILPGRAILAHALSQIDRLFRSLESAAEAAEFEAWARLDARLEAARQSWNPLVRAAAATVADVRARRLDLLARFRLLQSAVRIEKRRLQEGRYASEVSDLPGDPWIAHARVRYGVWPEGAGYAVWSVGRNGTDAGGRAGENAGLLVERRPPPP